MRFLGFLVLMLYDLSLTFPAPIDTTILQAQQWKVVGTQRVFSQVLLNGVSFTGTSQEVDRIIQTLSADTHLPAFITSNQTSVLRNHTVLRSRECVLEGSQLHSNDRVFYDGKVYLTLDHTDTWTAHVPQALALKLLWDQDVQRTRRERIRLQEGCIKLMRELRLSVEQSVPGTPLPQFLIPVLALLAFTGLIIISLVLSKKKGSRLPGAEIWNTTSANMLMALVTCVIGSIIHYPKDMSEMSTETKGNGYSTL